MSRYLYWKWLLQGTWWMFLVATLNSNSQTKTKPFQTARAELPSLPARFCKIWNANFLKIFTFSQEFLLSWDKDLDFLLAGHWEYMFLLLLEFFPHVILITWGLESGLAKFFFAESVPLWYYNRMVRGTINKHASFSRSGRKAVTKVQWTVGQWT